MRESLTLSIRQLFLLGLYPRLEVLSLPTRSSDSVLDIRHFGGIGDGGVVWSMLLGVEGVWWLRIGSDVARQRLGLSKSSGK